jgi:tetratricopeptide (TPR) repeat protein
VVAVLTVAVLVLAARPLWRPDAPPPPTAPAEPPRATTVAPTADPAAADRLLARYEQDNDPAALAAAMAQAGAVLRHDAASLPGLLALGRARDALQDFERARGLFERAGQFAPRAAAPDRAAGDTWLASGDLGAAMSRMLQASAKAPDELETASRILLLSNALEDFAAADHWADWLGRRVTRQADALAALAHHRYLTGNFEQAVQLSNIALRLGLTDRWEADAVFTRIKRDEAISDGSFARTIDLLQERHPALFEAAPRIVPGNIQQAVDLAFLLQQTGQRERAETLLRRAVDAYGEPGFTHGSARAVILPVRAEALALLGEERAALADLDRVVDAGWRIQWRWETDLNANFIALRDAAGFRRIIGRIEADVADQRRRLYAAGGS